MYTFYWLALLSLFACNGAAEETGDTQTDTGQEVPRVTLTGTLATYPAGQLLSGAAVCWFDGETEDLCASSDSGGNYTLADVPGERTGAVLVEHDDIYPHGIVVTLADQDTRASANMDTPSVVAAYFTATGVTETSGKALAASWVGSGNSGIENATMALDPASGEGPFYYGAAAGTIDTSATSTSSNGAAVWLEVDPSAGPFEVDVDLNGTNCSLQAAGGSERGPFEVKAGYLFYVGAGCPTR